MMGKERISFWEKFGYGEFNGVNNLQINFISTFVLFYFTNVVGFSAALAGIIISLGLVWDGISDPLIASYADNHHFRNGERFRPFMLYAAFPLALVTVLLFYDPDTHQTFKIIYYLTVYAIFYSLNTLIRLPMYNMPILASKDAADRLALNVFASGGASLGGILSGVMMWPIVRAFAGINPQTMDMINPARGYFFAALLIALLLIAGSLFYYFNSQERLRSSMDEEKPIGIVKSFSILWKNRNFRFNTLFSTLYWIYLTLSTSVIVYYTTYVINRPGLTTPMMGCFAIGTLIVLPFVKKLDARFGRRRAMIIGASLVAISKIIFIPFPTVVPVAMFHAFILGISVPINFVMYFMTRAEIGDIIGHEQNRRIDGMISNLQGLINKCGASLTVFFIGMMLESSGFNSTASEQSAAVNNMIIALVGWISLFIAVLFVWSASRITIEKDYAAISNRRL